MGHGVWYKEGPEVRRETRDERRERREERRAKWHGTRAMKLETEGLVDQQTRPAPTVIAKDAGLMGRRIRDAAGQHHVATVEKPSLAQAVYRGVAVRHE